jgi:hypothetical protein
MERRASLLLVVAVLLLIMIVGLQRAWLSYQGLAQLYKDALNHAEQLFNSPK